MCEEKISPYVWKGVVHEKRCVQEINMKDFHDKTSGVLFQIVVPPKSTIGFVSNLKQFLFKRCKRFFPNFSIIDLAVRKLHLLGVEGVIVEFMEGYP